MAGSGVYPVYENQFHVGKTEDDKAFPKDLETFSVSFANDVQKWSPFDMKGYYNHLITGKDLTISLKGKRNFGDTGNDFLADMKWKTGQDAMGYFDWTFPDGTVVSWESATFDVKSDGGDSVNVGPLEVDVLPNGKPTITPATA